MAKIKGVELKAVKCFKGHEGEPLTQGNIYMNGKKIGYYSEDFMSGPIHLDIEKEYEEKFEKIVDDVTGGKYEYMAKDVFIDELLTLKELEGDFKKAVKEGYKALILVEHPRQHPFTIKSPTTSTEETIKWLDENGYEKYKEDEKYSLKVYNDLNQFIVE